MRSALLALATLLMLGGAGVPGVPAPALAASPSVSLTAPSSVVKVASWSASLAVSPSVSRSVSRSVSPAVSRSFTRAALGWQWPVAGPRVVQRPFVAPLTPYGAGHRGVDLAAGSAGVEVRAVMSGIVHFAGVVVDRPVITVRSGQLLATVEPVAPLVAAGDTVEAGQVIGVLEPGHCATACVHLGVRLAGEYVSPLLYLGGLQRAVLLPLG